VIVAAAITCAKGEQASNSSRSPDQATASASLPGTTEAAVPVPLQDSAWAIVRMETSYEPLGPQYFIGKSTTLYFANGAHLLTDLFDVRPVGQLRRADGPPFLILAARGCTHCDINEAIYIVSPSSRPFVHPTSERRFALPGALVDRYTADTVFMVSRMFFGSCLPGRGDLVVWFHRFVDDSGIWRDTAFIAEPVLDSIVSSFVPSPLPDSAEVLAAVASGTCHELKGSTHRAEP
jgi:hypothetical protein